MKFENIYYSSRFKKDYKLLISRKFKIELLDEVMLVIINRGLLDKKYFAHKLVGNYKNYWECHIRPDWLLIWKEDIESNSIYFARTGSHSDLFR